MLTGLKAVRCWGNKVQLTDGRNYVDWESGLVGGLYGYAPDWWRKAISRAVYDGGTVTSIVHQDEQVAADMLAYHYPHIEAVRWMSNGSDPCAAAVKLARAVTGKRHILVQGYHGWASAYCTPPDANARPGLLSIDMRRGCLDTPMCRWIG
jgi:glutamate-1-semialdehyde aminotransferase